MNTLYAAYTTGKTLHIQLRASGAAVGSPIPLAEVSGQPGFYSATVPALTPAGNYEVVLTESGTALDAWSGYRWDGTQELPNPPGAPSDVGLCRVYGHLETPDNRRLVKASITFELYPRDLAVASERLIGERKVTVTTNADGAIVGHDNAAYVDLQRTDLLTTAGGVSAYYEVSSVDLGVQRRRVLLTASTADLRSLLLAL